MLKEVYKIGPMIIFYYDVKLKYDIRSAFNYTSGLLQLKTADHSQKESWREGKDIKRFVESLAPASM